MITRLVYAVLALIMMISVLVITIPYSAKWAVVTWLEDQGIKAQVEAIDINFRDAIIDIYHARGTHANGKGFVLDYFHFDFSLSELWDKKLRVENIRMSGLRLDVEQNHTGVTHIAGLPIAEPGISKSVDITDQVNKESSTAWGIELHEVSLADIQICTSILKNEIDEQQHLCIQLKKFDWLGRFLLNSGVAASLETRSDLKLSGLAIENRKKGQTLLSSAELNIDKIQINALKNVKIGRVEFQGFYFFPDIEIDKNKKQVGRIDYLAIDHLTMTDLKLLELTKVELSGLALNMLRNKNAQWDVVQDIVEYFPSPQVNNAQELLAEKNEELDNAKVEVRIVELEIKNSHALQLIDNSLSPPFDLTARIKSLQIMNLDSQKENQKSEIHANLMFGKYGEAKLAGYILPFSELVNFELSGKLVNIDLRPYSTFLGSLNHRINSGQLDADIKLISKNSKLDSVLSLDLQRFDLNRIDKSGDSAAVQIMGLPLSSALNLLKNRDDSIHLKLPVTGDITSPKFDLSDVIFQAVLKATKVAVINYYTPFGLVTAAQGMYDFATALRFKPIEFSPASAEIQQYEKLDRLLELFLDRPKLKVSLCGFANRDDFIVLIPEASAQENIDASSLTKLVSLAASRGEATKAYLVSKGLKPGRIILCQPTYDDDAIQGVAISI